MQLVDSENKKTLPKIQKGDPSPPILPQVMASSAVKLQLEIFGFLPTTHTETNANKMHPRSSHAVGHFMHVYHHAQTAADVGDIHI